jgi:hypothetical protein
VGQLQVIHLMDTLVDLRKIGVVKWALVVLTASWRRAN